MKIEDKLEAIELYEIYSPLLSDKQREIFEHYYFEDMSIVEIADVFEVSKNAVFK
ncbi:MAG: sigma factor-like helix-turn-helix DNA-binding protein, partial [Dysgonomonas sp.]